MVTKENIIKSQNNWSEWVVAIGIKFEQNKDYKAFVNKTIGSIYGLEFKKLLFKPTKASIKQFRSTKKELVSYFVGDDRNFPEDKGFALEPWKEIRFENASFVTEKKFGVAMGNYFFKNSSNIEVKVEYTLGYMYTLNGNLKIFLHHSSIPFKNETIY